MKGRVPNLYTTLERFTDLINRNCQSLSEFRTLLVTSKDLLMGVNISEFNSLEYFISRPVVGYLSDAVGPQGTLSNEVSAVFSIKTYSKIECCVI